MDLKMRVYRKEADVGEDTWYAPFKQFSSGVAYLQVAGFEVIFEGDGFGFSQFRNTTPTGMLNLINCVQARSPICIRAIHLINTPRLFNMVFNNMVKPFLNERIKVRTK